MNTKDLPDTEHPTCCGVPCKTAYCPHCGNKLREPSALRSLLKYLDVRQQSATKRDNHELASQFVDWICTVRNILDAQTRAEAGEEA